MMMPYPVSWWQAPPGETIVGMIAYEDMIIVSTDRTIYVIDNGGRGLDDHRISAVASALRKDRR